VLVIGTYAMTKFLNWDDMKTCTIFADGAGACVMKAIETREDRGFLASTLFADGTYCDYLGTFVGGTKKPATPERIERGEHYLTFHQRFPEDTNSSRWPLLIRETLGKKGLRVDEIDCVIFTQINRSVIVEVMDTLCLPMEKTHTIMDKWGYTGSACIPMALDDAVRKGKLEQGDLVVFCASGVGIAMAVAAFRW
jgi:3-oxoacyl-[acyl-carrier-protein] synthase-3